MSDATTDEATPAISWMQAVVWSVLITASCLLFAFAWEAIAQLTGDF